jgi:lipoate---protein ligase
MSEPLDWRVIPPIHADGHFQMALDEWLLAQQADPAAPAYLRFYQWSRPTLSLGYHQRALPDAWQPTAQQDLDLVRRPTGGRAVLHQGDLTYAIALRGLSGNRKDNYCHLCKFLIAGWRSLGVELTHGSIGRDYIHNPNCFGTATGADLRIGAAKFIGSAQRYQSLGAGQSAVLQHGSMLLEPDLARFEQVFGQPLARPESLPAVGPPQIIEALTQAAMQLFAGQWRTEALSPEELAQVEALRLQRGRV